MKLNKIITENDCEDFLDREFLIASGKTKKRGRKQFVYNPWEKEYYIYEGERMLDYGEGIEYEMGLTELLEVNNKL